MTNSSDNSQQAPAKKPKKKGPIRTGVVVPVTILIVLLAVYFKLFFDGNLRRGLEYIGSHVNGAEVDVGRISTSFLHARLEIDNIQMTDKEHPERNTVQVGAVKFQMSWDALLRAKVLVNEAEVLNIQALVPRKHPGFVIPPAPPTKSKGPSALDDVENQVLQQTRKDYNGNFLGDVAGVLGGSDPKAQLQNLQGELKSDAKVKALQKDLEQKKAQWDERLKKLPQGKELQGYADRVKALKFDFHNPGELAKNVQEAQKIISEANDKVKLIDQTQRDLKTDLNNYQTQYKELDKMVQEDVRDLQTKLKLPNIDAKEFSQQLFMAMIEKKLGSMAKYVVLARHYIPAKKTAEQKKEAKAEQVVPPKRGQGHTYHFPITTGYPLFWLKHAAISSEATASPYSGNIKGEIKDLTTDQTFIGRPTLLLVHGDFPRQDIHGLDAKITLDHRGEVAKESLQMKVAQFPVPENVLSNSDDVKLAFSSPAGSSEVQAVFEDAQLTMTMHNTFDKLDFQVQAKNGTVKEILDSVLKGIPKVDVNADIKGSLNNLDIHINSNLGDDLSRGFQKQLQAKIDDAKGQLQKLVNAKIGGDRDKLKGELDQTTGDLTKNVDGKKAEADKVVKEAQNQLNSQKGGGQKKLEEEGKKLLKGFGIGG